MSEAAPFLCGECPFFEPCHIGEDVADEDCWNIRRDAGLPLVRPEPEKVAEPAPVKPSPANPVLARALKRLAEDRKITPRDAISKPEPKPKRTPKPPREKPVREPKPKKEKPPKPERQQQSGPPGHPRTIPDDSDDSRPDRAEGEAAYQRWRYRQRKKLRGETVREPRPPKMKAPRQPRPRKEHSPKKTPEEVLAIRRRNMALPYEQRWGPIWEGIFGDRTPPVRSACLADREDLWQYAEARIAAGARSLPSDLYVLHRFTVEQLRDPDLVCVQLGQTIYPETASANAAASAIRRYRRVFGIDLGPDDVAVSAVRSGNARALCRQKIARIFGGREPPVNVMALATRPDLWTFAERALAAGFALETVEGSCQKLGHVAAEDLADWAKAPESLTPGTSGTARDLQSAIRRFRTIMEAPA